MTFDPATAKPVEDPDSGALAQWLRSNSPGLKSPDRVAAAANIVAAFKGHVDSEAAMRDILRASTKVLPQSVRKGIRREWYRAQAADKRKPEDEAEFWANEGPRILNEKFTGRGSWRAQAKHWLRNAADHVQRTAGVRADAPAMQAISKTLEKLK